MRTISSVSLSGGMGKTTCSFFLAELLVRQGHKVLLVDGDPQSSLSFYCSTIVEPDEPTLLEVLKKEVSTEEAIYRTKYDNLNIIPSDDALDNAQAYLAKSGMGATILRKRLAKVSSNYDYCIIDSPPQRSQISLTVIGASDLLLIPFEVSSKGVNSVCRTLDLVADQIEIDAFEGKILGVLPFRDRWVGCNQTKTSKLSLDTVREILEEEQRSQLEQIEILPSLRESDQVKKALDSEVSLSQLGYRDLEYPFEYVEQKLSASLAVPTSI